jgi:hypothetical protein
MKKFLAVYTGTRDGANAKKWEALSSEERKKREALGKTEWMNWVRRNEKVIVDGGSPVGKTKQVNSSGISDIRNNIAAFTIVQAETHEAAAKIFENHPHFAIFPGDSVEIMECLPIPL